MARARFLHRYGGVAPPDISSVTFDHDVLFKLPSRLGRRVAYSVDPVTALQDHVVTRASPHGLSPPAATVHGGRTLHNRSDRAA